MRQRLFFLLVVFAMVRGGSAADAQERWVFVPVLVADPSANASQLTAPLERTRDLPILPNVAAATQFESSGSSEPGVLTDEQLARLTAALAEGTKQLQASHRESAAKELTPIEDLDPKSHDYLSRAPARAQALFRACLLTGKALWDEDQEEAAAQHLLRCARTFPGFEPMSGIPPRVRKAFRASRAQLAAEPHGDVEIVSTQDGCVVRANGLPLGTTPLTLSLPVGVFRFQVECGVEVGRAHALTVQPGSTRISINTQLDSVVHTQGALWLMYSDTSTRDARMDTDGRALGQLLDSSHVVLLAVESGRLPGPVQVRARELEPSARDLGKIVLTEGRYAGPVGLITAQLTQQAQRVMPAAAAPSHAAPPSTEDIKPATDSLAAEEDPEDEEQAEPSTSALPLVAAVSLGALGAGGLVTGWVAYAQRFELRTQLYFQTVPFSTRQEFRSAGAWTLSLGAAGAALLAAAAPFVLPRADGVPASAWVTGGAGIAAAAVGLGFSLFGRHCGPRVTVPGQAACGAFVADPTFGPMIALHAIPLLAVTATYVIRQWLDSADIALSFTGTQLVLAGRF